MQYIHTSDIFMNQLVTQFSDGYPSVGALNQTEFAAFATLLEARREAGLTQAEVALRMGVSQPVLARIESSLGSRKHTPSLNTLKRYAEACGKRLVISMV